MNRAAAILTLTAALLYGQRSFAQSVQRIRGTIEQISGDQMTVKTREGQTLTLALSGETKYAGLKKSSLDEVQPGDFIGTATKGPKNFMVALEVVVFPETMRGTGEGQYGWDTIPDTTQGQGATATDSTMTNGNVDTSHTMSDPTSTTHSTMTNGAVSAGEVSAGGRTITVSYTDPKTHQTGKSKILLPPTAPVVLVQPGDKATAVVGAHAFIIASGEPGHLVALRLLVGENGVVPPM
jgi:hypothetical protein